jgi:hypothetical protein
LDEAEAVERDRDPRYLRFTSASSGMGLGWAKAESLEPNNNGPLEATVSPTSMYYRIGWLGVSGQENLTLIPFLFLIQFEYIPHQTTSPKNLFSTTSLSIFE